MSKKKITKHYTKSFINAMELRAKAHYNFLKKRPEIDWKDYNIFYRAIEINEEYSVNNFLKLNDKVPGNIFRYILGKISGDNKIEYVKLLMDNIDKFVFGEEEKYISISEGLRHASQNNNSEIFDYLLSKGADPNYWWVVNWTAEDSSDNQYKKLMMDTLGLKRCPDRKKVIELCDNLASGSSTTWKGPTTKMLEELL